MAVITLNGSAIHTIGKLPPIGTKAPEFVVTKTDLSEIHLKNYHGNRIVLNIFPSLDTETCASSVLKFNEIAKDKNILVLCVSEDLPFAQKRFCNLKKVKNIQPASVFRHPEFGKDYGVMMVDGPLAGLLSRAVVVIDEQGKIIYTEQVKELTEEPNYQAVIKSLNS